MRAARVARSLPRLTLTAIPSPAMDEDLEIEARIRSGEYRRLDELGPIIVDAAALERLRKAVERKAKRKARRATV